MEPVGEAPAGGVWSCPRCGARLVSRNLWHSCGQFTLEDLFARSTPETLELARAYIPHLADLDEELRGWLQESYDTVGVQADLPPKRAR